MYVYFKIIVINPETNIAEISLHALILHQNHLKIKIKPVPAPNIKIIWNSSSALVNNKANKELKTNRETVESLPTLTNSFSEAFLLICCL